MRHSMDGSVPWPPGLGVVRRNDPDGTFAVFRAFWASAYASLKCCI
jgi:hypothetical protein